MFNFKYRDIICSYKVMLRVLKYAIWAYSLFTPLISAKIFNMLIWVEMTRNFHTWWRSRWNVWLLFLINNFSLLLWLWILHNRWRFVLRKKVSWSCVNIRESGVRRYRWSSYFYFRMLLWVQKWINIFFLVFLFFNLIHRVCICIILC